MPAKIDATCSSIGIGLILRLLEQLGQARAAGEQLLRRGVEVRAELGEGGHLAILRELQLDRAGDLLHRLGLRGRADAQYREMAAFAQFGSDLDASTQKLLARGARLTELLKQPQYQPMPIEEQVASIFAGTQGFLDSVEVRDVVRYEAAMLSFLRSEAPEILAKIRDTKQLDDDTAAALKDALTAFGKQFA